MSVQSFVYLDLVNKFLHQYTESFPLSQTGSSVISPVTSICGRFVSGSVGEDLEQPEKENGKRN